MLQLYGLVSLAECVAYQLMGPCAPTQWWDEHALKVAACLCQVEKLQSKFALIHSTLAQQAALQEAPAGALKQSELAEHMSLMSLTDSASLCSLGKLRLPSGRGTTGSSVAMGDRDQVAVRDGKAAEGSAGIVGNKIRPGVAAGGLEASGCVSRQTGPGSLAAMPAAAGPLSKMHQGARTLSQQVVALAGGKVGDVAVNSIGHPDGALTKGVKAHAVALSQTTLTGH